MPSECPNPDGGPNNRCLGPLDAGTYTTTEFWPPLTYTVPEGWGNYEDLPGQVLLLPPGAELGNVDPQTADYIGVYRPVAAPATDCLSRPDPSVGSTAADYVDWLEHHPALDVTDPQSVSVADRAAAMVDVELSPDASDTCSDPLQGIDRFEEIMIGMSPADFSASVTPDGGVRVYLLDVEDRVLAAMVTHGHGDGDQREFLASAQQVIDSFAF